MPVSSDIYSQVQAPQAANPLAALAQAYQIKAYQSSIGKADREETTQNKLLELVRDPSFAALPTAQKATALQGVGAFDQAGKLVTTEAAANKDTRSAATSEFELRMKQLDAVSNVVGTVKDQPSYTQGLSILKDQLGIDTSKFSPTYDPNGVAQFAQATLSAKDRLANQTQMRGQDITMRGQDLTQSTALAGQDVTRRGQDMTQSTALQGQGVTMRGQDLTQGTTIRGQDLTNARAKEANPTGRLTEDQGKATGWLVQAENAFKNMKAAGFTEDGKVKSAAQPGLADAVASVPFMGGVGNTFRTADRQKFVQSSSTLSEALLRAATGAGVNKDEALQKIQELTPQWGEDAATTKQKMDSIPLYIETLKVRAGPGAAKADQVLAEANAGNTKPTSPTRKTVGGKTYENDGKGWYVVN